MKTHIDMGAGYTLCGAESTRVTDDVAAADCKRCIRMLEIEAREVVR